MLAYGDKLPLKVSWSVAWPVFVKQCPSQSYLCNWSS